MPLRKDSVMLRQQLMIDKHVQGTLLKRAGFYSLAIAIYFIVILLFMESMSDPDEPLSEALLRCLYEAMYWLPGLMLLAPVIAYDMLKLTNRFAGPLFRLQRQMTRLIEHESTEPLSFRDGDYWVEVADLFNEIRDELMTLRKENEKLTCELATGGKADNEPQSLFFSDDADDQKSADEFLTGSAN